MFSFSFLKVKNMGLPFFFFIAFKNCIPHLCNYPPIIFSNPFASLADFSYTSSNII